MNLKQRRDIIFLKDIFFIFGDLDGSGKWCAYPDGNYIFKVDTRNTRTRSEKYLKLTIKTRE